MITAAGDWVAHRFVGFFTATIRNPNSHKTYTRIIVRFLSCGAQAFTLDNPVYIQ
jgi:hypothetical protein